MGSGNGKNAMLSRMMNVRVMQDRRMMMNWGWELGIHDGASFGNDDWSGGSDGMSGTSVLLLRFRLDDGFRIDLQNRCSSLDCHSLHESDPVSRNLLDYTCLVGRVVLKNALRRSGREMMMNCCFHMDEMNASVGESKDVRAGGCEDVEGRGCCCGQANGGNDGNSFRISSFVRQVFQTKNSRSRSLSARSFIITRCL